jgi:hypothetical protein
MQPSDIVVGVECALPERFNPYDDGDCPVAPTASLPDAPQAPNRGGGRAGRRQLLPADGRHSPPASAGRLPEITIKTKMPA